MVVSVLMWIVFFITISYLIVIGIITYGWFGLSHFTAKNDIIKGITISVVIAIRNESGNILNLLKQLISQQYNSKYFDVIIIDDHSTDNSLQLINDFKTDNSSAKIKVITALGNGKKNALKEGIASSTAKLIVTTDGDCNVLPGWLETIVDYYTSHNLKLIVGPVVYENEKTVLQKFFSLDFSSLVASGAGSLGAGLPLMGNGANLAFERSVYNDLTKGNTEKYASGDDVFLIHNMAKKYGSNAIGFLRDRSAIVSTLPPKNISQFFRQRTRWASKATGYQLIWPIIVALTVSIFNLVLLAILVASAYFTWLLPVYFLVIITKFVIDAPLVFSFLSFTKQTKLKPLFFVLEFLYPVYIVFAVIASIFFKFEWKDRKQLR